MAEPTNKFREELEKKKAKEGEQLEQDAKVEYLQRKAAKELNDMDVAHLQALIEKFNEHTNRLFEQPNCPAREFYLKRNQEQIRNVQWLMGEVVRLLLQRAILHDSSKFTEIEKELFTEVIPKLSRVKYGSEEYNATLEKIKPAIEQHNNLNSHHPEHYTKGVAGMDLLDLLEMLCDWFASTKRSPDGDIFKSIEINQKRFGYSDELKEIFQHTVSRHFSDVKYELEEHKNFEETE